MDMEVVSTENYLAVVIVNDTSRKDHILMIVAKANRLLGFTRRSCAGIVGSVPLLRLLRHILRQCVELICSFKVEFQEEIWSRWKIT